MSKVHQLRFEFEKLKQSVLHGTKFSDSNWVEETLDEFGQEISILKGRCTKLENRVKKLEK